MRHTALLAPGALEATRRFGIETSPMASYRATELSGMLWHAKAARMRAEGGCTNRHPSVAILALFFAHDQKCVCAHKTPLLVASLAILPRIFLVESIEFSIEIL